MDGHLLGRDGDVVAWVAKASDGTKNYLALFNVGDAPVNVNKTFAEYGFVDRAQYNVRDLWDAEGDGGAECGDDGAAAAWVPDAVAA